jgi:ribonuclease HI
MQKDVYWCATRENQVKLNIDGSCIGNPGPTGAGSLLRNHCGELLLGFYESLGNSTSFHAELVGIYRGLFLTWELGYRDVVCHSSLLAVETVKLGAGEFDLH